MPDSRILIQVLELAVKDRTQLALENAALRHQVAGLKRSVKRPRIEDSNRGVVQKKQRQRMCLGAHPVMTPLDESP